jgi:hypothetical protein
MDNESKLFDELSALLNMHNRESKSDTPDFILAGYMLACLRAYEKAVKDRDKWLGLVPFGGR